jgi:hypothetical protein
MSRVLSLAGFQVTLIGRFWMIPEVLRVEDEQFQTPGLKEQNERCLQDFVDIWQNRSVQSREDSKP